MFNPGRIKKASAIKDEIIYVGKAVQPEKSSTPVFSEQQKMWEADGAADRRFEYIIQFGSYGV